MVQPIGKHQRQKKGVGCDEQPPAPHDGRSLIHPSRPKGSEHAKHGDKEKRDIKAVPQELDGRIPEHGILDDNNEHPAGEQNKASRHVSAHPQVEAPPTGERPPHRQKGDRRRHVRRRVVVPGRIECIPIGRTPYLMIEKPLRHEQQRDNRQGTAGAGDDDLSLINSSHARGSLSNQRRSP